MVTPCRAGLGRWAGLDSFHFGRGGRVPQGARNMVHQPIFVVDLESGDDTVILEGSVERVMERAKLEAINAVDGPKYAFYPLGEPGISLTTTSSIACAPRSSSPGWRATSPTWPPAGPGPRRRHRRARTLSGRGRQDLQTG